MCCVCECQNIIILCCVKYKLCASSAEFNAAAAFQSHEIKMCTLMLYSCFAANLDPFVPQLIYLSIYLFSASFPLILHLPPSISPLSLPSHLYQWNYCQGTVIIEFPESRTPATPLYPLRSTSLPCLPPISSGFLSLSLSS